MRDLSLILALVIVILTAIRCVNFILCILCQTPNSVGQFYHFVTEIVQTTAH